MNKTEKIVQLIKQKIEDKVVLEAACGTADFSLAASEYTDKVVCIDIDDSRLNHDIERQEKINFLKMDAVKMAFEDETFDTIVLYNALYHIESQYEQIIAECKRVLKRKGQIIIIGTWKLDVSLMLEKFGDKAEVLKEICIVRIEKEDRES